MSRNLARMTASVSAGLVVASSIALGTWAWTRGAAGSEDHPTVPQLIQDLEPQLNDEQNDVLADGVLTLGEYDGAFERAAACLREKGLAPSLTRGGIAGAYEISAGGPPAAGSEPTADFVGCVEKHVGKLGIVWAEQNRPTPEQLAAKQAKTDQCLVSYGLGRLVGVWLHSSEPGTVEHWAFVTCQLGIPGFTHGRPWSTGGLPD